jgi:DNA helicase II / ATP-dependent DNA helicase PcrA
MELVADLHVHSRFSRATSGDLDLEHLWLSAQRKGIGLVGTGDFTHPGWFAELEQKLRPAEPGLYELRPELCAALEGELPASCRAPVRFLLTVEVSCIYKRDGKVRKVHNVICLPGLDAAGELCRLLGRIGNLQSDGRPILGLDSRDLLELALAASPRAVLIPAHIWTPWFSALGSRSGFDSIEQCYRDLAGHVFCVETGLSSDPPMNWRLASLDRYALCSSSDAHSPGKLGREATLLDCELAYDAIFAALRDRRRGQLRGTLEFFPEEGKYHLDGHRACGVRLTPAQTLAYGGRCPSCGKPVTVGVLSRVDELADRPDGSKPEGAAGFVSLVGLGEVLGEVLGVGADTLTAHRALAMLLQKLGPELSILRGVPEEELRAIGGAALAEAVARMRRGEVRIEGGYDGEFGRVHLLDQKERAELAGQGSLFALGEGLRAGTPRRKVAQRAAPVRAAEPEPELPLLSRRLLAPRIDPLAGLTDEQRRAATHQGSPLCIVAGPGTGKTRTLTCRIAHSIAGGLDPARVLAVTFTQKAAGELRERLRGLLGAARAGAVRGGEERSGEVRVSTFHALGLCILSGWREARGLAPLRVIDETERLSALRGLLFGADEREVLQVSRALGRGEGHDELGERYRAKLRAAGAVDLDGLVAEAVRLLGAEPDLLAAWRERCAMVCVDEYQDVNCAQYELVRLLCPPGADLCVIGDPDQAIYAFRGAQSGYFLRFLDDYPGAARYHLERSHRSAAVVLEAAQRLIAHDPDRLPRRTFSELPGPSRLGLCRLPTAAAEAELVVAQVEKLVGGTSLHALDSGRADGHTGGLGFADIGVLFRTRVQAEALLAAFDRSGIPCCCSATRDPAAPLQPIVALLELEGPPRERELLEAVAGLPPRAGLTELARRLCPGEKSLAAAEQAIEQIAPLLFDAGPGASAWGPRLLGLLASSSEADALPARVEAISLLTLHASKGLEFDTVFIVGCEEGLVPHLSPATDLAEERRLLYVGMTRARRQLVLCWAEHRGRREGAPPRKPSRFLEEIGADFLESLREAAPRPRRRQLSLL